MLNKFKIPVEYGAYHKQRFLYLMQLLGGVADKDSSILDVGVSDLTVALCKNYKNLTTLDLFERNKDVDERLDNVHHIIFDLQDLTKMREWFSPKKFDVIIFAEVIEHLAIAPEHILVFFHSLLNASGKMIIQTPNPVCLHNRIRMLFGRNPFERLRPEAGNGISHGHIREYTKRELFEICESHFEVTYHSYKNYFNSGLSYKPPVSYLVRLFLSVAGAVPSLRRGQTLILQKRELTGAHGHSM